MSDSKASQSINLPQLQNLIKRDPESYRDEVCVLLLLNVFRAFFRSRGGKGSMTNNRIGPCLTMSANERS